jgi:threo-3-hydroxy-L-aspartate ammonia-lyase
VVGVEPAVVNDAQRSLRAGSVLANPPGAGLETRADGLRVDRLGNLTWPHVQALVDDIVTVDEDEIMAAVGAIAQGARLVAEPSGAVSVAAWLFHRAELGPAERPVAIVSGGNVDPLVFREALVAATGS